MKEDPHGAEQAGRRSDLVSSHTAGGGHRGRGGYHKLRDPPWGTRGASHVLGTSALGSDMGKTSPLGSLENQWDLLIRAVRN